MFYLDNSETSWLVYADWLEDQDINASHIRQEIIEPTANLWSYEHPSNVVGSMGGGLINFGNTNAVGTTFTESGVGFNVNSFHRVGSDTGSWVGGGI